MAKKTIAISGANGFIGSALVDYFKARNFQVVALVRRIPKTKAHNIQYRTYDLTKAPDIATLKNVDYVLHAAYIKQDRDNPDAFGTNTRGTEQLVECARRNNIKKIVFISSVSAKKDALSTYGKQKYTLESLFSTSQGAVVRPGLVIGNGGLVQQIAGFIKKWHVAPLIDGGNQPVNIIALADLLQAIETVISKDLHGIITVANPKSYTYNQFYKAIAAHLKIRLLLIPIPFFIPLLAVRTAAFLRLPLPVNEDNLWGLKKSVAINTKNDLAKLNLTPMDLPAAVENIK